jgi:Na+-driven multidrug efflux pump
MYALLITVIRQLVLYVPCLLLMNRLFGFTGLIWTQPMTECIMMVFSLVLLSGFLKKLERDTF